MLAYEDLISGQPDTYQPLDIDESAPMGLCYTSGTTGQPKGVVSTHRSTFLHALAVTSAAGMAIGPGDCVLPQVPMFHATAWGMPYAAAMVGAKQVFFGGALDAAAFVDLMVAERVTVTAGVPTVWLAVAEVLAGRGERSARPPAHRLRRQPATGRLDHSLSRGVRHRARPGLGHDGDVAAGLHGLAAGAHARLDRRRRRLETALSQAGLPLPGVRITIRDADGRPVARDGSVHG